MPIHPLVVHFSIALSLIFPFSALFFLLAIKQGRLSANVWKYVFALAITFLISAIAALKAGESEEEIALKTVPEESILEHEQRAQLLTLLAALSAVAAGIPLLERASTKVRDTARVASVVVGFGSTVAAGFAGYSGGSLVYEKGAADSYLLPKAGQNIFDRPADDEELEE